jgi:hypothetical protein
MKQSPALSTMVGRGGRFFKELEPKKSSSRSLYCKSKAADRVRRLQGDRREMFMPYENVGTVCEGMRRRWRLVLCNANDREKLEGPLCNVPKLLASDRQTVQSISFANVKNDTVPVFVLAHLPEQVTR